MNTNDSEIQYDTAALQRQWPVIVESRLRALRSVIDQSYIKATGLLESDPPELWQFALSKSEPRTEPPTQEDMQQAKELGDRLRKFNPAFDSDISYTSGVQQFLEKIRDVSLRQAMSGLEARAKNDDELTKWVSKLLRLHERPQITREEYQQARKDSDKTVRFLIKHWIQDPPNEKWAVASLCFFSNLAMAKMAYFFSKPPESRKWLPLYKEATEKERIKKTYHRLKLKPAKPRIFRDVDFKSGKLVFLQSKEARAKEE